MGKNTDGWQFRLTHPEVLAISPAGRTNVIMTPDGAHDVVDLLLVAFMRIRNGKGMPKRKR